MKLILLHTSLHYLFIYKYFYQADCGAVHYSTQEAEAGDFQVLRSKEVAGQAGLHRHTILKPNQNRKIQT